MSAFRLISLLLLTVHSTDEVEDSTTNTDPIPCSTSSKVICIGLGTYGQSLCRTAFTNNLTVIDVFDTQSTTPQPISEVLSISQHQQQCHQDITTSHIDSLSQRLSEYSTNEQVVTALIGLSSSLDTLNSAIGIIEECLSHSVNVVSIMTPSLSPLSLHSADDEILSKLHHLHQLAMTNNVEFRSRGMASFLRGTFPNEKRSQEITGRVTCNADYIAYIHRMEKPNVWFDWFIGERVPSYHDKASSLSFYKLMRSELRSLTQSLLMMDTERGDINDWMFTFNSKALYDQHGETVSKYLNRIIETGRITAIRYTARLMNEETDESIHLVVKIGLFKDAEERKKLTPCHIEWELSGDEDEDGERAKNTEIKGVDIIAAMMDDAVRNVDVERPSQKCGACCHEMEDVQQQCLKRMNVLDELKKDL